MSTKNNKKDIASQAILDAENIKAAIKEESKKTIAELLKEEVKNSLRESVEDEKKEDDYEIQDEEQAPAEVEGEDENSEEAPEAEEEPVEGEEEISIEDDSEADADDAEVEDAAEDAEVPEEGNSEEGEEWLDQYKVDDDTYDLTGEKDYDEVVKVYKRLNDDDSVVIRKDGNKVSLKDDEAGTEYVIEIGGDEEEEQGFEITEDASEEIAGLPMNESKKNRKTMKENKEVIFEVDLGYTDNYQNEDPIEGLSNEEPSKFDTFDKGIPTGTEKPWAKDAKKKGEPFKETVAEEIEMDPIIGEETPEEEMPQELEEGGARTSVKKTHKVKSASNNGNPQIGVKRTPNSDNGKLDEAKKYKAMVESLLAKTEAVLKENKDLRESVSKVRGALQETLLVNRNLGKITKLFMENTTSQNEKNDIVNRFNEVKSFEESDALYESINRELNKGAKQTLPLQETSMVANGSVINETKLYESQDLLNVKNFIKRMENC